MVLPFVEFSNALLLGCPELEIQKLQRTQNRGLRIALHRDRRCQISILHTNARLADWRTRAMIALNKLMFKFKNISDCVEDSRDRPRTRLNEGVVIHLSKPRNNVYLNSVSYIGRTSWNKLPSSIRNLTDIETFGMKVKKLHTNSYFGLTTES